MIDTSFVFTGSAILKYNFSENATVYAGVSKGRRPPVLHFNLSGEEEVIPPEKIMSYEAGFKTIIRRRLWFDAAGFYQNFNGFRATAWVPDLSTGQANQLIADNNKSTSYGVESSLKAALLKGVELFGNFAWIHARFDKADSADVRSSFSGNTFRLTPEYSFTAGMNLKLKITKQVELFAIPAYSWKSHFWFNDLNSSGIDQDAYGILNATAGIDLTQAGVSLSASATNILDDRFLISGGHAGSRFGIPTFVPGAPRMVGMKLTWRF